MSKERDFVAKLLAEGKFHMNQRGIDDTKAVVGDDAVESSGVKAIQDDAAEEADAVVCQTLSLDSPMIFPDNVIANCAKCGTLLQHRPHAPKKPPKICIACAMGMESNP